MPSISQECFISYSRFIFTTFWPSRISIQHFAIDSSLFWFSFFYVDKVKLVKLGNWVLLFPTHTSWIFLHFIGLECFFHLLDNSLMLLPICEVLDRFGKCFSHLWGFACFCKSAFLSFMSFMSFMSCLPTTLFSFIRMYYHFNNANCHLLIIR